MSKIAPYSLFSTQLFDQCPYNSGQKVVHYIGNRAAFVTQDKSLDTLIYGLLLVKLLRPIQSSLLFLKRRLNVNVPEPEQKHKQGENQNCYNSVDDWSKLTSHHDE